MKQIITRTFTILLVVCFCLCSASITFARPIILQEDASSTKELILYEDENVKLYQTTESYPTKADNYGNAWVENNKIGSFTVYNTITGTMGVTWKVESSSSSSYAQIYMTNPLGHTILNTQKVYASDGDVRLVVKNGVRGNYTVNYHAFTSVGMRIMCWTYPG